VPASRRAHARAILQQSSYSQPWRGWMLRRSTHPTPRPTPNSSRAWAPKWRPCSTVYRGIGLPHRCPGGGMAYAGDLKSLAREGVRVRLPPRAPTNLLYLSGFSWSREISGAQHCKPQFASSLPSGGRRISDNSVCRVVSCLRWRKALDSLRRDSRMREKERHSADSQAPLPTAQSKFPNPHWITSFSARLPMG
jgi:hypothetical protein